MAADFRCCWRTQDRVGQWLLTACTAPVPSRGWGRLPMDQPLVSLRTARHVLLASVSWGPAGLRGGGRTACLVGSARWMDTWGESLQWAPSLAFSPEPESTSGCQSPGQPLRPPLDMGVGDGSPTPQVTCWLPLDLQFCVGCVLHAGSKLPGITGPVSLCSFSLAVAVLATNLGWVFL